MAGPENGAAGIGASWRRSGGSAHHGAQSAKACLRDLPHHLVVRRAPGIPAGLAGGLLAAQAQGPLLVAIIHVPDPGDGGVAALV